MNDIYLFIFRLGCVNITEEEFTKLCGLQGEFLSNLAVADAAGAAQRTPRTVAEAGAGGSKVDYTSYKWIVVDCDGVTISESECEFLNKTNCVNEFELKRPYIKSEGEVESKIGEIKHKALEEFVFSQKVYEFLLRQEFKDRLLKYSSGSYYAVAIEKDDSIEAGQLELHAKPAHLRVSPVRLYEACKAISKYFCVGEFVKFGTAVKVISHTNPATVLSRPKIDFEYEFSVLDLM